MPQTARRLPGFWLLVAARVIPDGRRRSPSAGRTEVRGLLTKLRGGPSRRQMLPKGMTSCSVPLAVNHDKEA